MAIPVTKVPGGYVAMATPPHSKMGAWRTNRTHGMRRTRFGSGGSGVSPDGHR
jgi:hypothetical protein